MRPRVAGGISYAERVAMACRIARLNREEALAEYYAKLLQQESDKTIGAQIADPSFTGGGDRRLTALLRHVDLVTQAPKNATHEDIIALKEEILDLILSSALFGWANRLMHTLGEPVAQD